MKRVQTAKDLEIFIKRRGLNNIGYMHQRMKFNCEQSNREKAFARVWRKENYRDSWKNSGFGILQDLFFNTDSVDRSENFPLTIITKRDRVIAATIIQWLGSNCGFSFVCKALQKAGYKITKIQ